MSILLMRHTVGTSNQVPFVLANPMWIQLLLFRSESESVPVSLD